MRCVAALPLLLPLLVPLLALGAGCSEERVGAADHCALSERHDIVTADGAGLALHRHRGGGADSRTPPVLVVHGISSNHHCWDLTPDRSLGVYLAEQGMDAWLLDLRGHGDSTRDARGHTQRSGWTVDDYGRFDVPAAVAYIQQVTGSEKVAYVGHSMGGMVGAIYMATVPSAADDLSALVAVGSPLDFTDPDPVIGMALQLAALSGPVLPVVQSPMGASLQASVQRQNPLPVNEMLFNDIAGGEVREEMYRRIVSPLSGGELKQFGQLVDGGHFRSADGQLDYLAALERVNTPVMVIAGRADNIAPVDRVLPYYQRVGASKKAFVLAGRAAGFAADYGHLDLTLGDHAREEIYPIIRDWLTPSADGP
jgi:pimeloyl-ACP methyl ester carboxylesterase